MSEYQFSAVNHPPSKSFREDVLALWRSGGAVIDSPDERIRQLGYAAYTETGELVGVCSYQEQKGCYSALPLYGMRVFVAAKHRESLLAYELLAHLSESLIDQRGATEHSNSIGLCAVIETDIVNQRGTIFVERTFQFAVNKKPLTFRLTGFTPQGSPEYTYYFEYPQPTESDRVDHDFSLEKIHEESPEETRRDVGRILVEQKSIEAPMLDQYVAQKLVLAITQDDRVDSVCLLIPQFIKELNATLFGVLLLSKNPWSLDKDKKVALTNLIFAKMNAQFDGDVRAAIGLFVLYTNKTQLPVIEADTEFRFHAIDNKGQELRLRYFDEAKVDVPFRVLEGKNFGGDSRSGA